MAAFPQPKLYFLSLVTQCSNFKISDLSQVGWQILALRRQRQADRSLGVPGKTGLHSEFQSAKAKYLTLPQTKFRGRFDAHVFQLLYCSKCWRHSSPTLLHVLLKAVPCFSNYHGECFKRQSGLQGRRVKT